MARFQSVAAGVVLLLNFISCVVSTVRIQDVNRAVVVSSSVVEVLSKVSYINNGDVPVDTIYFSLSENLRHNIAVLSFKDSLSSTSSNVELRPSTYVKLKGSSGKMLLVPIELHGSLSPGHSRQIEFREIYTNMLRPEPATIKQLDPNRVVLEHSIYLLSQYVVEKQSFTFKYSNLQLEAVESNFNFVQRKNSVTLEIAEPVAANSENVVRFRLLTHFASISHANLHRKIFISEYGEVRFVDSHVFCNKAANITGEYSRLYEHGTTLPDHVVNEFTFFLPYGARNIRYRDMVGNISTSTVYDESRNTMLNVAPRFPLYGGWNTEFTISYTIPVEDVLSVEDGQRVYSSNLLGDFRGFYPVEEFRMEIILPENAKDISFDLPTWISFDRSQGKTFYYLDYFGRPTIIVSARNLVMLHDKVFTVKYWHSEVMLLLKPLLMSLIIAAFFVSVSLFSRLKFVGGKKKDPAEVFLAKLSSFKIRILAICEILRKQESFISKCVKEKQTSLLDNSFDAFKSEYMSEEDNLRCQNNLLKLILPTFSHYEEKVKPKIKLAYKCIEKEMETVCSTNQSVDKKRLDTDFTVAKKKFDAAIKEAQQLVNNI